MTWFLTTRSWSLMIVMLFYTRKLGCRSWFYVFSSKYDGAFILCIVVSSSCCSADFFEELKVCCTWLIRIKMPLYYENRVICWTVPSEWLFELQIWFSLCFCFNAWTSFFQFLVRFLVIFVSWVLKFASNSLYVTISNLLYLLVLFIVLKLRKDQTMFCNF